MLIVRIPPPNSHFLISPLKIETLLFAPIYFTLECILPANCGARLDHLLGASAISALIAVRRGNLPTKLSMAC
jgi:hypothetical protein